MNCETLTITAGQPFNVRQFGAMGDGLHDDTAAIQAAIDAALAQGSKGTGAPVVLIPAGRYMINSFNPGDLGYGARLLLDSAHGGKLHIRGEGDATLAITATPQPAWNLSSVPDALLACWGGVYVDLLIENLTFRRPCAPTTTPIQAISINAFQAPCLRPAIRNCTFTDFPQAIALARTIGAVVESCRWNYTDGAQCGHGNANGIPNVGIRCDGCADTRISGNYWIGTDKTSDAGAHFPMDGLLWGTSRGWTVTGNTIKRAWVEGIFILQADDPAAATIIADNAIDCDFPTSINPAHARNAVRLGIRADDFNITITGNNIRRCRQGIAVNMGWEGYTINNATGGIISGNSIRFDSFDACSLGTSILMGIVIQFRTGLLITGNAISFPAGAVAVQSLPVTGITLASCVKVRALYNAVTADGQAADWVCGVYLSSASTSVIIQANLFESIGTAIATLASPAQSAVSPGIVHFVPRPTASFPTPAV